MSAVALLLASGLLTQDKPNVCWLEDLDLSHIEQGWGRPQKGKTVTGKPIVMGGRTYLRGVGTHANSKFLISLNGKATQFNATVGVLDNLGSLDYTRTSIQYQIIADGKYLLSTGTMRQSDRSVDVSLDVTGVNALILQVLDGGDGNFADHAVWADARVTLRDPKMLPLSMPVPPTLPQVKALEDAKKSGDNAKISYASNQLGVALFNRAQFRASLSAFEEQLKYAKTSGNATLHASALHGITMAKLKCGEPIAECIRHVAEARQIAARIPSGQFLSDAVIHGIFSVSAALSPRPDQQLSYTQRVVEHLERNPQLGAQMWARQMYIRLLAGNRELDKAREAVLKWRSQAPSDPGQRLSWLKGLAMAAEFARLPGLADMLHRESIRLAQDPSLNWIDRVEAFRLGSPNFPPDERLRLLKEAERVALISGDQGSQLNPIYEELYNTLYELGRYQEAQELLVRLRTSPPIPSASKALRNALLMNEEHGLLVSQCWADLKQDPKDLIALYFLYMVGAGDRLVLAQAFSAGVPATDWSFKSLSWQLLAVAHAQRGDQTAALASIQAAKEAEIRASSEFRPLRPLSHSGSVLRYIGRATDAVADLSQSYEAERVRSDGFMPGFVARNYAIALCEVGQPERAEEIVREMLSYRRQAKRSSVRIPMLYCRGLAQELMGTTNLAGASYREAIKGLERRRLSLAGMTSTQMADFAETRWVYQRSLLLDVQAGNIEQAFQTLQAAKARSLQDVIAQSASANSSAQDSADRTRIVRELRALTEALNDASAGNDEAKLNQVKQQVAAKETELREVDERTAFKLGLPSVKPVADLGSIANRLGEDGLLLDFAYIDANLSRARKRAVLVFGIDKHGGQPRVRVFRVERPEDVSLLAANLESAVSGRSPKWFADAKALSKILPPAEWFVGKRRMILCGDGPLSTTPLHVLPDPEDPAAPLGLKREVSYVYAATTIGLGKTNTGDLPVFALSDPNFGDRATQAESRSLKDDLTGPLARGGVKIRGGFAALPGTRLEAEAIKGIFPKGVFVSGNGATQSAIKSDGVRARYVHMATHGIANSDSPLLSCLVLAPDQSDGVKDRFLAAGEVLTMPWKAEMVVLSACDTANGARMSGEGVIGLGWAFFAKGVRTQVLSQWKVDDEATAFLMKSFYTGLSQGENKAKSLKDAMAAVSLNPKWAHPYYWAPFVCLGEPS